MASAKEKASPTDALKMRQLYPSTSKPTTLVRAETAVYGYAIWAAKRMMDAVRGSKGAIGASAGLDVGGALAGLNEMMHPMNAGAMRVGMAQWRRTCQKAGDWKTLQGGYGTETSVPASPLGVIGTLKVAHGIIADRINNSSKTAANDQMFRELDKKARRAIKSSFPFCRTSCGWNCWTAALTSAALGRWSMMLLLGLGGSGGKLLGVIASKPRGDWFGVLVTGECGRFKKVETSRRSLVGVSLIGSRAVTRRPVDDLGLSIDSDDGAKRPLGIED